MSDERPRRRAEDRLPEGARPALLVADLEARERVAAMERALEDHQRSCTAGQLRIEAGLAGLKSDIGELHKRVSSHKDAATGQVFAALKWALGVMAAAIAWLFAKLQGWA